MKTKTRKAAQVQVRTTVLMWIAAGVLMAMLSVLVVSAMTFNTAMSSRLLIAELTSRVDVKTEDRYRTQDAQADFATLRDALKADADALASAVKTRDAAFQRLEKRLRLIEWQLKQQNVRIKRLHPTQR